MTRPRLPALLLLALALASAAPPLRAEGSPRPFAIRAKTIYPVTTGDNGPISNGVLIVRDGKIDAIGRGLTIPPDCEVIDLGDAVICPGFVAAASLLGGANRGDVSVSGAYRAADQIDQYADYNYEVAAGVTTAHLGTGNHRLVSGRGAVVKLGGAAGSRVLRDESDLSITLGVFSPPIDVEIPFAASSDVAIEPAKLQRPYSRLGQILELQTRIAEAVSPSQPYNFHQLGFSDAWSTNLPLRIEARRGADIRAAAEFLRKHNRAGYLVGVADAEPAVAELLRSRLPVVLRLEPEFRFPGSNIGPSPDALEEDGAAAGSLAATELKVALAGRDDSPALNPQMLAAIALRGGMPRCLVLPALTRIPAEILGVADRVGSLAPGRDADFVVFSADPLEISSRVLATYIGGVSVFSKSSYEPRPDSDLPTIRPDPVVIRAGTLWLGDGQIVRDGEILVRDGKIAAVGQRVGAPAFARVVDAGDDAFVTPGFIDAHGHLGLAGDRTIAAPDLPIDQAIGVAGREFVRVARAGVTTVMLAAYRSAVNGSRVAAIKTFGTDRTELVARPTAGMKFSVADLEAISAADQLRKTLESARKYDDSWKKYDEELAKWKADKAAGVVAKPKEADTEQVEQGKVDPISGTWEFKLSGAPLPEEVSGTMRLRLTGTQIEGRLTVAIADEEVVVNGTLEGDRVVLEFDEETPVGKPRIEARLDREDHMAGDLKLGDQFSLPFSATRTSKDAVEFKVTRKRQKSKDGRPNPPKTDEVLEPFRALLSGKAPALIEVREAAQAEAMLRLFVDDFKIHTVLIDAQGVADLGEKLAARKDQAGIVVPPQVVQWRSNRPYDQAADLSSRGVRIAFQSAAEDAARNLPLMALYAVQRGLGGDDALRALTSDAARLLKIDDRVGTIAPGKDGDLLIFSGHPFDSGSRLERVLVNGREVPDVSESPN